MILGIYEESKISLDTNNENSHFKYWKWGLHRKLQTNNISSDREGIESKFPQQINILTSEHPSQNSKWMIQNVCYYLILTCKKLKSLIEDTYNIEFMLENNSLVTKEMEYYAQIYEIEYTLREEKSKVNLEWISKILDSISHDLMVQSNIYFQQEYIKYKIYEKGKDADISLIFHTVENKSNFLNDSQILAKQSVMISLFIKLE